MGHHDLAILVPVLDRPQKVEPLLWSATIATPQARLVFVCDPGDIFEREAIAAALKEDEDGSDYESSFGPLTVQVLIHGGGWATKINHAVRETQEALVFFGADDLDFHLGWFDHATAKLEEGASVVGVNDLIPRRKLRQQHATHFLVRREYLAQPLIDGQPGPLYEGYRHNFVDDEFIGTARKRGVYKYAPNAHVRHDHPMAGGMDDATYRKGRKSFQGDRILYRSRARLWT